MSGTVWNTIGLAPGRTGARSCTVPPTLVRTETSWSAVPLLRMSR